MKVREYDALSIEEKIQLLLDKKQAIIDRNIEGDVRVTDARTLSLIDVDIRRLQRSG